MGQSAVGGYALKGVYAQYYLILIFCSILILDARVAMVFWWLNQFSFKLDWLKPTHGWLNSMISWAYRFKIHF